MDSDENRGVVTLGRTHPAMRRWDWKLTVTGTVMLATSGLARTRRGAIRAARKTADLWNVRQLEVRVLDEHEPHPRLYVPRQDSPNQ